MVFILLSITIIIIIIVCLHELLYGRMGSLEEQICNVEGEVTQHYVCEKH